MSVQVFQEFYHQATRPTGRLRMTHEQALAFLDPFMGLPSVPVTRELFNRAAQVAEPVRHLLLGRGHTGGGSDAGLRRRLL